MSKSSILEDVRQVKLTFTDANNVVVLPTLGDGNCFFHSVLRAFNTNYIKAKSITDRVNMARTFRNALADLLEETDPLTGKNYYSGLNNGELEKIAGGVKEYSLSALQKELRSSAPVDNIYQELISNSLNKDIYIIDGTKKDMYHVGSAFSLYYKGRNSIIIFYVPGHFEVVGIKHSDGSIDTLFTPEHPLIQACKDRLLSFFRANSAKSPKLSIKM
jgi:hypothetical protein